MSHPMAVSGTRTEGRDVPRPARLLIGLAEFGLLIALTYVFARLIWLVAFGTNAGDFRYDDPARSGAVQGPAFVADLARLRSSDLFADRRAAAGIVPEPADVPETRLNLTLHGTRLGAPAGRGGAIIQTPDNRQRFFPVGAEILDGVTLDAVHADHVLIRRRGIAEALYLREEAAARNAAVRQAAGQASAVSARSMAIEGLFRAEPVHQGNRLAGYRIAGGNAAMLSAMGLRNGDVITAVDGRSVADVSDLPALFGSLRDEAHASLSINRGGLPLTVQVDLP